ncbi:MAG: anaerobic ribonucleoside-triphosphate reductase, partial [Dictyoglomi bacterium]|nr:anaerobic ribonucleoside-triphosphate reductase [Dictyoglomota bacterium]
SDMDPDDVRSMCCRLRLDNEEIRKRAEQALMFAVETGKKSEKELEELKRRGGGLFGANPLTGSIGVVTINLPRIGYEANGNVEKFFEILAKRMDIAKESLEIKRKVIEEFTQMGMYPYAKFYLRSVYDLYGQYWANHFNTIGIIGMHEAILNMTGGKYGIEHPNGREFAVKVMKWMRERLVEYQKETGNIYNLEASPAEGASYRLARIDKKEYPDIITSGESEPYYTNSTFLPVYYTEDMFEALDHQDELQSLYTGGTVFHGFLGENITDPGVVKELVRVIAENYTLPYITITPTYSICPDHGYIPGEHERCPICGKETEVYSRVVGYLRPIKSWNDGKQEEFKQRLEFSVKVPSSKEARQLKNR